MDNYEIVTGQSLRDKLADKLGLNRPSVFDSVRRADYATEDAYLDALTAEKLKRSAPEYQTARREIEAQYRAMREQEEVERMNLNYSAAFDSAQLTDFDRREARKAAVELAQRDLSAGRIGAGDLELTINKYAEAQETQRRKDIASSSVMNALFRSGR